MTDAARLRVLERIPVALRNLWHWQERLGYAHIADIAILVLVALCFLNLVKRR